MPATAPAKEEGPEQDVPRPSLRPLLMSEGRLRAGGVGGLSGRVLGKRPLHGGRGAKFTFQELLEAATAWVGEQVSHMSVFVSHAIFADPPIHSDEHMLLS